MDYYKALGVDKNASESDIKKAYRKLAQENHPDTGKGNEAKFKEVTEAYEVLGDKQKRAQYDQFGSTGPGGAGFGGFGQGFGGFNASDFQNVQFDFGGGFGDIFESFFGSGGRSSSRKRGPQQGNNIEMVIQITFEESISGATKEIEISRYEGCTKCEGRGAAPGSDLKTCETCSGTGQQIKIQRTPLGQIQTATVCGACEGAGQIPEKKCPECRGEGRMLKTSFLKAKIPAGVQDRAVIRIREKGEAGTQGGPYGDLFLHISVIPSKEFKRVQDDIHSQVHLHVLQAILGDEILINTVHGEKSLKIPAGIQSGTVLKIKGEGAPRVGAANRGDHHATIIVEIPTKLSSKEKKLYEELTKEGKLKINAKNKGIFG